jgi:hypothetical protein
MKKATEIFSAEEISSLNQAVARAEQQTSGEIVCVVAARSDDYPRAEDIAGIWLGLLLVAVCWYIFSRPPSGSWGPALLEVDWKLLLAGLVVFLVGFILGAILADRLPLLKKTVHRAAADARAGGAGGRAPVLPEPGKLHPPAHWYTHLYFTLRADGARTGRRRHSREAFRRRLVPGARSDNLRHAFGKASRWNEKGH